jgi:hypothetical protein
MGLREAYAGRGVAVFAYEALEDTHTAGFRKKSSIYSSGMFSRGLKMLDAWPFKSYYHMGARRFFFLQAYHKVFNPYRSY